ncbi:gas vesicle protein GvpO, halophile-type [Natronococcus occultus]|uniref:Nicotinate-mononucleotide:5, 6-dimethylbenzimidazole phosphoribosyltransferase CobT n=1 Tax=Natronococcus occultus SP4 TaxID=694430 RepID=L0JZU7_9EURY|nr:gas vesicle protein GvpO [Natronococcus occultus]AGB38582.1 nicotinate-mononucleotide:5,6-dimethylbenzimidazole phosphoribosyltransferase CobT [Natronococcus occultus SP4]
MSDAETTDQEQCRARTGDDERCSRPAQEDGFCYQHDESDPTVSETQSADEQEQEQDEQQAEDADQDQDQDVQSAEMADEEATDPEDVDADDVDADDQIAGVLAIRKRVRETAGKLIGHEFDGVSEISPMDEGWRAVVEVVERSAVPDTQDIIGRYEIELDEDGVVQGYRRLGRYRRGDTKAFE